MSQTRTGLYPGTFDPLTNGHLDIISRATKLLDRLVIAVAINPGKGPAFTLEERVAMVEAEMAKLTGGATIEVMPFRGLLVDFAAEVGANIMVRGLRAVVDYEYEFQLYGMNSKLNPDVESVFLMADARYQSISSSLVKEIAMFGGDISQFVPEDIAVATTQRMADRMEK
jgi:pantetheine-phosphate adenylyltransferase